MDVGKEKITAAKRRSWPEGIAFALIAYAFTGGTLSLIGWWADIARLTDWDGDGVSIQPNTALAAVVSSAAVVFLILNKRRVAAVLSAMVALIGLLTLTQIVFGVDLFLDRMLLPDRTWGGGGVVSPGRMGGPAALSWTLLGGAGLILALFSPGQRINLRRLSLVLATIAVLLSAVALTGYLYGATTLYRVPQISIIAIQTSTFVLAIAIAIVLTIRDLGITRLLTEDNAAGLMARRIVPAIIAVPVAMEFARRAGESAGLYSQLIGYALGTLLQITTLFALLALTVRAVRRQTTRAEDSERRFSRFMSNLPGLAWIKDQSGRYVYVNESAASAFGRSPREIHGKTDEQMFPADTAAAFTANDRRVLDTKSALQTIEKLRTADGSEVESIVNKFPIVIGGGDMLIGGVAIDVTAQQRARATREFLFQITERIRLSRDPDSRADEVAGDLARFLDVIECRLILGENGDSLGKEIWIPESMMSSGQTTVVGKVSPGNVDERSARVSYIAAPLMRGGAWTATFLCIAKASKDWSPEEITLVETVADRLWNAIERQRFETELRASRDRFKLAQEAGNVGVWDWDAKSDQTYWSETMWAFHGETDKSVNPDTKYWADRLHPDDRDRVVRGLENVLASDRTDYRDVFRIVDRFGNVRSLESIATITRSDNGHPLRMYGVCLDVSHRVASEESARTRERQLRLVTDSIPALVSYIDSDLRYRFVNAKYTEWFGMTTAEILGKQVPEVLGHDAFATIRGKMERALTGEVVTYESEINYRSAGLKNINGAYVPDIGDDGIVRGFYALITDITELRRSEELLRVSQDRMRVLTESFTDYAIISLDVNGVIESWNPGAANIYGYKEGDVIGRSAEMLFTPEDAKKGVPRTEMETARTEGRVSDERWQVRKDGSRFFASGVMVPLYVGDAITGYAKIATDLTERKRNAEALQRAHDEMELGVLERTRELAESNRSLQIEISERRSAEYERIELLKRLVTSQEDERRRIARDLHDQLGQRMTALRLKIESLREIAEGHAEIRERAARLQQIAEILDRDIGFLAWELRPSILDEHGLTDAVSTLVNEWGANVAIDAEFHAAGLQNARVNSLASTQLYRIVQEALNNIAKHSGADLVTVLLERRQDDLILIVEDNGDGFVTNNGQPSGTNGLGLAGMKERAELINAGFEIETTPGRGTAIYVKVKAPFEQDLSEEYART